MLFTYLFKNKQLHGLWIKVLLSGIHIFCGLNVICLTQVPEPPHSITMMLLLGEVWSLKKCGPALGAGS